MLVILYVECYDLQCFCCTTLMDVIFVKKPLHECHINDLYTTKCSGMLGHRSWYQSKCCDLRLEKPSKGNKPVGVK